MFRRVLVAARGEIAVRIIRACQELGVETVAVYSQADRDSLHVRLADCAVCIGPPPSRDSYLNMSNIISAGVNREADAVHPGCGFLAENASFAEACESSGLTFIGPTPAAMEAMGDKAEARSRMQAAGLPILPGSDGPVGSDSDALKVAKSIGYPLVLKASAGGGGKGIRVVRADDELLPAVRTIRAEAQAAFGIPDLYIERYLEEPRHVEVQVLADEQGHVLHLGERECSIQSRHQKLLEEAPSPALTPALRRSITDAGVQAATAVGYTNAGTVEFLLDGNGQFYFMEMNTRIQVEHPVTEAVTGLDLVKLQIHVAAGQPLPLSQEAVRMEGHAIECRINATDPQRDFAPCTGRIDDLILPGGPGVRVDTHVYPGYSIPPYYDALLAKIITWGADREEAIARMLRSLGELHTGSLITTATFQQQVLEHAAFRSGRFSTHFLAIHFGLH